MLSHARAASIQEWGEFTKAKPQFGSEPRTGNPRQKKAAWWAGSGCPRVGATEIFWGGRSRNTSADTAGQNRTWRQIETDDLQPLGSAFAVVPLDFGLVRRALYFVRGD